MNLRFSLAAALLLLAPLAHADKSFTRTLGVSATPDLYVSTGAGDIHVTAGSGDHVIVVGHVHAGWSAFGDVNARIDRIVEAPPITQSGNEIRVGEPSDRSLFNNISIDYEITVPSDAALNLHSGSGDVTVKGAGRFVAAASGSGNLHLSGVHGAAQLQTGSGDIELEETAAGEVHAKSGSGNIRIHNLNGPLTARTGSGDVEADGHLQGASNLASGSGGIRLQVDSATRFNLEASTGSGDIHVTLPNAPQQTDDSRHHLTGPVNGGGAPLEVRTGSGDITISPR